MPALAALNKTLAKCLLTLFAASEILLSDFVALVPQFLTDDCASILRICYEFGDASSRKELITIFADAVYSQIVCNIAVCLRCSVCVVSIHLICSTDNFCFCFVNDFTLVYDCIAECKTLAVVQAEFFVALLTVGKTFFLNLHFLCCHYAHKINHHLAAK